MRLKASGGPGRKEATRGQALIEFALVFPLFWLMLIGLIEFSFAFHAVLSISTASRNAVVMASEAGNSPNADCAILHVIEGDIGAPSSVKQIQKVDIYWTDGNGVVKTGKTTTYTRSTSSTISCVLRGISFTVPYSLTVDGYPMNQRCSTRSGCSGHVGLDTIGVKITYLYQYHTPYGAVMGGSALSVDRSSEMRLEPYQ